MRHILFARRCRRAWMRVLLSFIVWAVLVWGLGVVRFRRPIVRWQMKRIEAALRAANPEWTGGLFNRYGAVEEWAAPVMACRHLSFQHSLPRDLSLLRWLAPRSLALQNTRTDDLSPLAGMPLTWLECYCTRVDDLSPLRGMALTNLNASHTRVADLSPLRGMPLRTLNLNHTRVRDLAPLKGMPLEELHLAGTAVDDLAPLAGMPLRFLNIHDTPAARKPLPEGFVRAIREP